MTGVPEPFPELGSSKSVVGERQAKRQQTVSIEEKTGGKQGLPIVVWPRKPVGEKTIFTNIAIVLCRNNLAV